MADKSWMHEKDPTGLAPVVNEVMKTGAAALRAEEVARGAFMIFRSNGINPLGARMFCRAHQH